MYVVCALCVFSVVYVVLCVCVSESFRRSRLPCPACSIKWEASSFDDDEGDGK